MSDIFVPDDPGRLSWAMTIGELLDKAASRNRDKVYLYYQEHQVTYRELLEHSLRTASLFKELGVGRGDRVCAFLPNGLEILYIWMALSRLGAICVPINTAYKQEEMSYILNNCQARALVSHHTLMDVAVEATRRCPSLESRMVVGDGGANRSDWSEFWDLLSEAPRVPLQPEEPVTPKDISMLVYTSGTTGNPKGVMISHQMYVAAGQGFATWTGSTSEDRFFTCLPYFHANTHYYSTMGSMAVGASLIVEDRFSASRFWDQVRQSKATVVNFIGMMMTVLLKQQPSSADSDNSARIFYGVPTPTAQVLKEFEGRFGVKVLTGFGMTETSYGAIERLDELHRDSCGQPRWHPDPRFHNEIRIVGDDGKPLSPGNAGEITVRNPAVMPGYWSDPERTREALRDGWLYTGDLGMLDEDGHLYFVDRKKDVVRRRGENISSREVEDVIKRHPGVLDCAIIAVPSELGEEEVKAYVVPRPSGRSPEAAGPPDPQAPLDESPHVSGSGAEVKTARLKPEDIVLWCAERLAYFKVPRYVEIREDLPRTPTFRVRKDALRQEREDLTSGCFDREQAGIQLR